MPIEDVDYLKAHSTKQNHLFLVDSKDRDRSTHPTPSEYVVRFATPFQNIVGMEVLEATIPRTMYNVDVANNAVRFCIYSAASSASSAALPDAPTFTTAHVPIGDYSLQTLLPALNEVLVANVLQETGTASTISASITVSSLSSPPDVRSTLVFTCPYAFIIDMESSTIAEALGFDLYATGDAARINVVATRTPGTFTAPVSGTLIAQGEAGQNQGLVTYNGTTVFEVTVGLSYVSTYAGTVAIRSPRLYASTDRAWPFRGPDILAFEGPRGVLRSQSITNTTWVAQRWTAPYNAFFVGLDVALTTTSAVNIDDSVRWELRSDTEGNGSPGTLMAAGPLAISFIDGAFSDATVSGAVQVSANQNYWIVVYNDETPDAAKPVNVLYNDVTSSAALNTTTFLKSNAGAMGPWVPAADGNSIFYHMSARVRIAQAYHRLEAPGIVSLVGERYVTLRCPEIEDNMIRSLSVGRHALGLAKLRLGIVGFSENRVDFNKIALREFHPIGKLTRLTLRFERSGGELYDFKGVNHTIVFAFHYYEPKQTERFQRSLLNANYTGDVIAYARNEADQEEESDDQSVDYNEDDEVFAQWERMQQRCLPEQQRVMDLEALDFIKNGAIE